MKFSFFLFAVSSLLFFSCKEDPELTILKTDYSVVNYGETINISVKTNQTLELLISPDCNQWVHSTFNPQTAVSVDGIITVPFTIDKSNEYNNRTAVVSFSGGGLTSSVTFVQEGCVILDSDKKDFFIPFEGKSISITIQHNLEYDILISDKEWIQQTISRGISSSSLSFDVLPNETYDFRHGTITLKDKNSNFEQIISITQGSKPTLTLDKESVSLGIDGGTISIIVSTNVDYKIAISDDWISELPSSRGVSSNEHTFKIAPFSTEDFLKNGFITIYNDSVGIKRIVEISQLFEPEKIDLGLPSGTKWSSTNLGTCRPYGFGQFFAWGEVVTKDYFSNDNYTLGSQLSFDYLREKGIIDEKGNLVKLYDASSQILGEDWHIPTNDQIKELQNEKFTTILRTNLEGVAGVKITSKKNGNSIFLPYSGYIHASDIDYQSAAGLYWSSTFISDRQNRAYYLTIGDVSGYWSNVTTGFKIRPVSE